MFSFMYYKSWPCFRDWGVVTRCKEFPNKFDCTISQSLISLCCSLRICSFNSPSLRSNCCNRIAISFSALTCSISLFNLAKFPSTIVIEFPLYEEGNPLFRISELSSSGSAAPVMGAADHFVDNSKTSGIVVIVGVGDIVEDRGETVGMVANSVALWTEVCTAVWYDGTVAGIYWTSLVCGWWFWYSSTGLVSLPLSSYGGAHSIPPSAVVSEVPPCLERRKQQQNMVNTAAMIAIAVATTLMAILAPAERPLEGVSDVGVVLGIAEGGMERVDVVEGAA